MFVYVWISVTTCINQAPPVHTHPNTHTHTHTHTHRRAVVARPKECPLVGNRGGIQPCTPVWCHQCCHLCIVNNILYYICTIHEIYIYTHIAATSVIVSRSTWMMEEVSCSHSFASPTYACPPHTTTDTARSCRYFPKVSTVSPEVSTVSPEVSTVSPKSE
jgi:hypothetical protein